MAKIWVDALTGFQEDGPKRINGLIVGTIVSFLAVILLVSSWYF